LEVVIGNLRHRNIKFKSLLSDAMMVQTETVWSEIHCGYVTKQQKTSSKVVVNDPSFWFIPLRAFMGSKQEDFIGLLNNFDKLPPLTKEFTISPQLVSIARDTCASQRQKFALKLFREVCSVGETFGRNVTGRNYQPAGAMKKDRINPHKIDAIHELCCQYFPSRPGEELKDWRTIIRTLDKARWRVDKFIQDFLDISPIINLQNVSEYY
jgi:hypothetical protein